MGILEDLLGFVWESKDRKTLQKIVNELRDKIKKTELDGITKEIMMGELDWIDKHYHITREEHGFDESKIGECFEKLEDFAKRNEDIFKEGRVADERFKIPFSGKTSGEIRELETTEKGSTEEKNMQENEDNESDKKKIVSEKEFVATQNLVRKERIKSFFRKFRRKKQPKSDEELMGEEEIRAIDRQLLKEGIKKTPRKIYEGKPSENVEKYAKIILPIAAIFIGIIILTLLPGLWIIGIPAIIIGIGYLLIVAPEMDKFSFKQKIGALIIITGGLLAFVFGVIWYGLALLFLGGAFIVYDWIPKGKGRLAIKIIELGATLALLILIVPAFLNWAGISISLGALIFFSGLNTFLLFLLWSWSGRKSMKEALEEELLASKEETEKLLQDKIKKEIERLDKLAKKRDESGPKMEKLYNWILKRREKKLDKLKDKKESFNGEEDKSKEGEEE